MSKATIEINAQGSTTTAEELLEHIDFSGIQEVSIQKLTYHDGGPVDVTYEFKNFTITVHEGFGVGYYGTGPTGLVNHLEKIGFSKETAERVFTYHGQDPLVLKP